MFVFRHVLRTARVRTAYSATTPASGTFLTGNGKMIIGFTMRKEKVVKQIKDLSFGNIARNI